ncbi:hypothetical protein GGF50DRAFT_98574 [Schizophyllum commune]
MAIAWECASMKCPLSSSALHLLPCFLSHARAVYDPPAEVPRHVAPVYQALGVQSLVARRRRRWRPGTRSQPPAGRMTSASAWAPLSPRVGRRRKECVRRG